MLEREWNILYLILDDDDEIDVFGKLKIFSEQYPFSIAKAHIILFYLKDVMGIIEVVNERG